MKSYLIGKEEYQGKTFSGSTMLRDYLKYSKKGWSVIWSGEGKIAMVSPKPSKVWRRK
jgi:hypothetical protein